MITVREELCTYCGGCVSLCPFAALELAETRLVIACEQCTGCGLCIQACPTGALFREGERPAHFPVRRRYDLIVVGAGPAGSTAARVGAERGMAVLLVEKRQEIGSPVRCAEGINREMLLSFIEPEDVWISAEVNQARITAVDTGETNLLTGEEVGYVLERRVFDFDRVLAEKAVAAGAQAMVKTMVEELIIDDGVVRGIIAGSGRGQLEIEAPIVIGADGVEAKVGRWARLGTALRKEDCLVCAQYMLAGIEMDPNCCYYYLGEKLAPGGYAWVFPKGEGKANVGLGVQADLATISAAEYLHRFIGQYPFLEQGSPLALITGNVPVGIPSGDIVADGLMLIGDAASQVDPLTGGGIANAMVAGRLAAEIAAQAVEAGDNSKESLKEYEGRWREARGRKMERNYRLKERFSAAERTSRGFLRAFAVAAVGK